MRLDFAREEKELKAKMLTVRVPLLSNHKTEERAHTPRSFSFMLMLSSSILILSLHIFTSLMFMTWLFFVCILHVLSRVDFLTLLHCVSRACSLCAFFMCFFLPSRVDDASSHLLPSSLAPECAPVYFTVQLLACLC